MSLYTLVNLLSLLLVSASSPQYDEDSTVPTTAEMLSQLGHILVTIFGDETHLFSEDIMDIFDIARTWYGDNVDHSFSVDCLGCRTAVGFLKGAVDQGLEYEDVRDVAISVCYSVLEDSDEYDGIIMCEGMVDNYGPHVMNILNITEQNPQEICVFFGSCDSNTHSKVWPDSTLFNYNNLSPRTNTKTIQRERSEEPTFRSKSEYTKYDETFKVLHLTDMHIDLEYSEGAPNDCMLPLCCRDYLPGNGSAHYWGDFHCNFPPHTARAFLEYLAPMEPDVIIYTGDNPPHAIWEETLKGQLAGSEFIAELIAEFFPGVPTFTTLGNHEPFPTNIYYIHHPDTQSLNENFTNYWSSLGNFGDEQIATMKYAGYFSILLEPHLRILSYNSNYGADKNWYNILNYVSDDYQNMRDFMNATFTNARNNDEKLILLGHHPSGSANSYHSTFVRELTLEYGDLILLHLQGHSHADNFRMAVDPNTGVVKDVQISSPTFGSKTEINPSARMFYLDPDSYKPLDFDNFYLNLGRAIETGQAVFELDYRATEEYGMPDVSAESFADFVSRMETDDDLYYLWKFHERTGNWDVEPCTGSCRRNAICRFRTVTREDYRQCRES